MVCRAGAAARGEGRVSERVDKVADDEVLVGEVVEGEAGAPGEEGARGAGPAAFHGRDRHLWWAWMRVRMELPVSRIDWPWSASGAASSWECGPLLDSMLCCTTTEAPTCPSKGQGRQQSAGLQWFPDSGSCGVTSTGKASSHIPSCLHTSAIGIR